jgi:nucleoside-diphosphate-sugar epimerase
VENKIPDRGMRTGHGAAGFIGCYLVETLHEAGDEGLPSTTPAPERPRYIAPEVHRARGACPP